MLVPSKFTSFDESILARLPKLIRSLEREISVYDLFQVRRVDFEDVGEFIIAIDTLFILGVVELDLNKWTLRLC